MKPELEKLPKSWTQLKTFVVKFGNFSYNELNSIDILEFFIVYNNCLKMMPKKKK